MCVGEDGIGEGHSAQGLVVPQGGGYGKARSVPLEENHNVGNVDLLKQVWI